MPGFGGTLSDEEIRAVLAYIKSSWPPKIRAEQQRRTEPRGSSISCLAVRRNGDMKKGEHGAAYFRKIAGAYV